MLQINNRPIPNNLSYDNSDNNQDMYAYVDA